MRKINASLICWLRALTLLALAASSFACKGKFQVKTTSINASPGSGSDAPTGVEESTPPSTASFSLVAVADRSFANATYLTAGEAMTDIDVNAVGIGDTGLSYSCTFDTTIDNAVNDNTDCEDLPGTATFSATTGVLSWTPAIYVDDAFEVKVKAMKSSTDWSTEIFVLQVARPYTKSNLLLDVDARYATGLKASATQNVWQDLTLLNKDGVLFGGAWTGTGLTANPYALTFNGINSRVDFGDAIHGQGEILFDVWIKPDNSDPGSVILSSGAGEGTGFVLQHSELQPGKLEFALGEHFSTYLQSLNPVLYYRMNDTTTTIVDAMGNHNATISGGYTQQRDGNLAREYSDKATLLDGTSVINGGDIAAMDGLSAFSMSFWMKPSVLVDGAVIMRKIMADDNGIRIALDSAPTYNNRRLVIATSNGDADQYSRMNSNILTNNVWSFITVVYDGSGATNSDKLKLYHNGGATTLVWPVGVDLPASLPDVTGDFMIGHASNGFNGDIDEFAFFNYPLTQEQVRRMYALGSVCRSGTVFENNVWYNIVGTFFDGGVNASSNLVVNGNSECSRLLLPPDIITASTNLVAGANHNGTKPWSGSISELRVYSDGTNALNWTKTNFKTTSERVRQHPLGILLENANLSVHLDAANANQYTRAYPDDSCSWVWAYSISYSSYLQGFGPCGNGSGWNGSGVKTDPYRLVFDGINDFVDVSSRLNTQKIFSLGVWVKAPLQGQDAHIVSYGDSAWSDYVFALSGDALTNKMTFTLSGDGSLGGAIKQYRTSAAIFDDTWHYVFVTTDCGTTDCEVKVYIDGKLDTAGDWLAQAVFTSFVIPIDYGIVLGGRAEFSDPVEPFSGHVAMLSVWDGRVLTQDEVVQMCKLHRDRFENATCE